MLKALFENLVQGPVSRRPEKLFGPVKPFLFHLYQKTEKRTVMCMVLLPMAVTQF